MLELYDDRGFQKLVPSGSLSLFISVLQTQTFWCLSSMTKVMLVSISGSR